VLEDPVELACGVLESVGTFGAELADVLEDPIELACGVLESVGTFGAELADVFCEEDCDETVLLLLVVPATVREDEEDE